MDLIFASVQKLELETFSQLFLIQKNFNEIPSAKNNKLQRVVPVVVVSVSSFETERV